MIETTFDKKEWEKEQLLNNIIQGETIVWRNRNESQTILLIELAGEGLVKRESGFGFKADLTDLGVDVVTKFGGYSKWKADTIKQKAEDEERKKQDNEIKNLQLKKLKYDYKSRHIAVIAIVISIISFGIAIYNFIQTFNK